MHELALTQEMLDIAISQAEAYKAGKILSMKVKYGTMTMMEPECFKFYFLEFSKDTIAEGAVLEFEKVVTKIECQACSKISELKDFLMICPECGSINVNIISGEEIFLEDIEVDL